MDVEAPNPRLILLEAAKRALKNRRREVYDLHREFSVTASPVHGLEKLTEFFCELVRGERVNLPTINAYLSIVREKLEHLQPYDSIYPPIQDVAKALEAEKDAIPRYYYQPNKPMNEAQKKAYYNAMIGIDLGAVPKNVKRLMGEGALTEKEYLKAAKKIKPFSKHMVGGSTPPPVVSRGINEELARAEFAADQKALKDYGGVLTREAFDEFLKLAHPVQLLDKPVDCPSDIDGMRKYAKHLVEGGTPPGENKVYRSEGIDPANHGIRRGDVLEKTVSIDETCGGRNPFGSKNDPSNPPLQTLGCNSYGKLAKLVALNDHQIGSFEITYDNAKLCQMTETVRNNHGAMMAVVGIAGSLWKLRKEADPSRRVYIYDRRPKRE